MINLEGIVVDIRFKSEDSYYTVLILDTDDGPVTVVGKMGEINIGDSLKVSGNLIYHNLYGEQIQVERYEKIMPSTGVQIEKYLASGIFPFIGKKTASSIVKLFGEKSLEIITEDPEKLKKIRGLGKKKIKKIHEVLVKEQENRNTFIFLHNLEIGNKLSMEIYKKYKSETIDIIRANPYILIEDIRGIGFNIADKIAIRNNIGLESSFRIRAGIIYALSQSANISGNCYLEKDFLIAETSRLLNLSKDLIEAEMEFLKFDSKVKEEIRDGKSFIYLKMIYDIEKSIVSNLLRLIFADNKEEDIDIEKLIENLESKLDKKYSRTQKEAIVASVRENIMVITGGPGTGKTTIIKGIIEIFKELKKTYILCAPTGRASKRMEESTGDQASTIHRLLGYKSIEGKELLDYNEDNPLNADVIIVDEMSMVDIYLMNNLLKALDSKTKIIFVGDVDQLPSVGPGNVLRDLIDSKTIHTIKLDQIFRQGEGSNIVKNAHLINSGRRPILNEDGKDFFFIHTKNDMETLTSVVDLVSRRLPTYYKIDSLEDIQVLTPSKKGVCGTESLNAALQNELNPKAPHKEEVKFKDVVFRELDKVMQIKNNYDIDLRDKYGNLSKGIYNGDMGFIRNVFVESSSLELVVDDKTVKYAYKDFDELSLSYAITIHKSQGSEFSAVVIPVFNAPYLLMTRNILYTAITRARDLVVLVGSVDMMYKMIDNEYRQKRNSSLGIFLREAKISMEEMYGI